MRNKKRDEILGFIDDYQSEHGYAPSYTEIGDAVGLSSKSSVYNHIQRLFDEGKLETDTGRNAEARAIRVASGYRKDSVMMRQILLNQIAILGALEGEDDIRDRILDECMQNSCRILDDTRS